MGNKAYSRLDFYSLSLVTTARHSVEPFRRFEEKVFAIFCSSSYDKITFGAQLSRRGDGDGGVSNFLRNKNFLKHKRKPTSFGNRSWEKKSTYATI